MLSSLTRRPNVCQCQSCPSPLARARGQGEEAGQEADHEAACPGWGGAEGCGAGSTATTRFASVHVLASSRSFELHTHASEDWDFGVVGSYESRSMTCRRPGSTASVASLRSAQQRPSQSASRSSLTGLTTASLRKEVQDAVAAEVAKMMQPLKEKLQAEQTTRQRLEKMLKVAKGQKA
ncbi:unnamed protein product [Symbiodinium sp. CCMP2592]|nr:unnamed protein product [Symbiodinium sp. CCMP2592]